MIPWKLFAESFITRSKIFAVQLLPEVVKYTKNMNSKSLIEQFDCLMLLQLSISMARGKPCQDQVDLSMYMLDIFNSDSDLIINGSENDFI